jgi:UPF0148 protein
LRNTNEDKDIKKMADLLRQGATLTDLACPACASPLFKLKNGDLWCTKCEKKVVIVKEGEEPTKVTSSIAMGKVEITLLTKIQELQAKMQDEQDPEELRKLGITLSGLLENLEKVRRITRT